MSEQRNHSGDEAHRALDGVDGVLTVPACGPKLVLANESSKRFLYSTRLSVARDFFAVGALVFEINCSAKLRRSRVSYGEPQDYVKSIAIDRLHNKIASTGISLCHRLT